MRLPRLSKRLECVARLAGTGEVIADIGCDHGLMPIKLVGEGRFRKAILSDIREGPLKRASANIRLYSAGLKTVTAAGTAGAADPAGTDALFDLRLGGGLETLEPGEADVVTVSGLSGLTVAEIIGGSPEVAGSVSRFVLQPNTLHRELRVFLWENGFEIVSEVLVEEHGKFYPVMECRPDVSVKNRSRADSIFAISTRGTSGESACEASAARAGEISAIRAEFGDFIPGQFSEINKRYLTARLNEALSVKKAIESGAEAASCGDRLNYLEEITDGIGKILAFYNESEGNSHDSQ